jgi:transcriptional regulator with XRE-family HTH domain
MSQRAFAAELGIPEKNLSDIELGRRSGSQKFLDYVIETCDKFDEEVKSCVDRAETMLATCEIETVHLEVDDRTEFEWQRCVIGRAAVESGLIVPVLVGAYHRRTGVDPLQPT